MSVRFFCLLVLSCLYIGQSISFAQVQSRIDSMKAVLQTELSDNDLVRTHYRISGAYWDVNTDSAMKYSARALEFALTTGDTTLISRSYHVHGISNYYANQYDSALENYVTALSFWEEGASASFATHSAMGTLYRELGEYEQAIQAFQKGVSVIETHQTGNRRQRSLGALYNNIGSMYNSMGQLDSSFYYTEKAITMRRAANDQWGLARSLGNLGYEYYLINEFDKASAYLKETIAITRKLNRQQVLANALQNLALVRLATGRVDSAYTLIDDAIAVATEGSFREEMRDSYGVRMRIDTAASDFKQAFKDYQEYTRLKDIIFNQERARAVAEAEARYDAAKKDAEISRLVDQNEIQTLKTEKKNTLLWVSAGGIVLMSAIVILLYRWYAEKKRANKILAAQKEEILLQNTTISKTLADKELLIQEIYHRTKNNLSMIQSLLVAQSRRAKDEKTAELFDKSSHRVHSINLIHQQLYRAQGQTNVKMKPYLLSMVNYLKEAVPGHLAIEFQVDVTDQQLDIDQAIPVGLIVNEAITNAIKYAFVERTNLNNQIRLRLIPENPTAMRLEISDNGLGNEAGWHEQSGEGTGKRLLKGLARQLNGQLMYEFKSGTSLYIIFPIHDQLKKNMSA